MSYNDNEEVDDANETILDLSLHSTLYRRKNNELTFDYLIKRNTRIINILWCVFYFSICSVWSRGDLILCVLDGMWFWTILVFVVMFMLWREGLIYNPIKRYEHFINRIQLNEFDDDISDKQLVEFVECYDSRWSNARRIYYKQKILEQLELVKSIMRLICAPFFIYGLFLVIRHFR